MDGCWLLFLAPMTLLELRGEGRDRVAQTLKAFAHDFKICGSASRLDGC